MNAQQLKNSILQEAIEGRLVPQDPNDEPASVLLDKIRKEKARLVKEGKLKKKDLEEIPISEDEKPFEIPESWEWCRLRDIISLKSGECIKIRSLNQNLQYPVYGGNGINGTYDSYNVEANILIIGRVGFYCGCVHKTTSKAWVTDNALIVTTKTTSLNIDFLNYALKWLNLSSTSNSTAQPVVSGKGIYPLLLPLPPLAEQKRIVAKIEELLSKVEAYGKAQEKLDKLNEELPEKLKKSILQEAIEGRLVPQDPNDEPASVLLEKIRKEKARLVKEGKLKKKDLEEKPISEDEIPFEIPESWEWVKMSSLTTLITKGTTPRGGNVAYLDKGIGFLRAENIDGIDKLNLSNLKYIDKNTNDSYLKRSILQENDVLITIAGTLGRTALVRKEDLPLNANQAISLCRFADIKSTNLRYVLFALNAPLIQEQFHLSRKVTAIPNLTLEIIADTLLPLPPLAEQKRIVAKVEQLLLEIDKLKN